MRSSIRAYLLLVALGAGTATTMFACAETDAPADPPAPPTEAGLPSVDAQAPIDAPADAVVDADAALPECSRDGFCYTAVPPDQTLRGVWGDGLGVVWAVTEQGAVLRWNGTAWIVHASQLGALSAIWGSGPTDVWLGGEKGLYHGVGSASATLAFVASAAPGLPTPITSIWGTGANDVWAVGGLPANRDIFPYGSASGRVLHHTGPTDAGAAWTLDPISSQAVAYSQVWGSAASGVWIAGARPIPTDDFADEVLVFRKAAAGAFVEVVLPRDPDQDPVFGRLAKLGGGTVSGASTIWILGRTFSNFPGYWKGTSTNGGATFAFTYEKGGYNDEPAINAVWGIAANDTWAVGDYGRIRHRGTTGAWQQAALTRTSFPITNAFHAAWSNGPNDLWAVGEGIALHLDPSKKTAGTP